MPLWPMYMYMYLIPRSHDNGKVWNSFARYGTTIDTLFGYVVSIVFIFKKAIPVTSYNHYLKSKWISCLHRSLQLRKEGHRRAIMVSHFSRKVIHNVMAM